MTELSNSSLLRTFFAIIVYQCSSLWQRAYAQQAYCWDPCSFNCPRMGPRLCPPETILTYYDCCQSQGCCQYVKWPNLVFLILIILMLLAGCGCCFFFLFTDARHRMLAKRNRQQQQQEKVAQTVAATEASRHQIHTANLARTTNKEYTSRSYPKRSTIV